MSAILDVGMKVTNSKPEMMSLTQRASEMAEHSSSCSLSLLPSGQLPSLHTDSSAKDQE